MIQQYSRLVRLTKTGEFSSVFAYRCVARSSHFSVFVKPNPNTSINSRLGMTIGRRLAPKAVARNYMKRVIREIFRRHWTRFAGLDIVVQPRQSFRHGTYAIIESELLDVLEHARKKCPISC